MNRFDCGDPDEHVRESENKKVWISETTELHVCRAHGVFMKTESGDRNKSRSRQRRWRLPEPFGAFGAQRESGSSCLAFDSKQPNQEREAVNLKRTKDYAYNNQRRLIRTKIKPPAKQLLRRGARAHTEEDRLSRTSSFSAVNQQNSTHEKDESRPLRTASAEQLRIDRNRSRLASRNDEQTTRCIGPSGCGHSWSGSRSRTPVGHIQETEGQTN